MSAHPPLWLIVRRGGAPLLLSMPHTGSDIPAELLAGFVSPWLAVKDTDWHVEKLYAFAERLDATLVRTLISRSVIDPNRDPSGVSLYPGQTTTELCPTTTFDGEPLYRAGAAPTAAQIEARRGAYFDPYHRAIDLELTRLRGQHPKVVLYDCHSIRSRVPRLLYRHAAELQPGHILGGQLRARAHRGGRGRVRCQRFHARDQRPFPGRVHVAPLRAARARRARRADGARLPRLPARARGRGGGGHLADRVGRGLCRAHVRLARAHSRDLPELRHDP